MGKPTRMNTRRKLDFQETAIHRTIVLNRIYKNKVRCLQKMIQGYKNLMGVMLDNMDVNLLSEDDMKQLRELDVICDETDVDEDEYERDFN